MQGAASTGLGPNDVVQLINREKAVVIDVCEPNEFAAGHVVGARNIPFGQLEEKLPQVVKNKALPVVLVCQSGMLRRVYVLTTYMPLFPKNLTGKWPVS